MFDRLKAWVKGVYNYIREEIIPYVKEKLQKEIAYCDDCGSTYIIVWNEGTWKENYNKEKTEEYTTSNRKMVCGDCDKDNTEWKIVWRWTRVG